MQPRCCYELLHVRFLRLFLFSLLLCTCALLCSCATSGDEAYTGRRWFIHTPRATCFCWGYVKKAGQSWDRARLVIMDERAGISPPYRSLNPDGSSRLGEDHNCEYAVAGRFTGETAYDPNSDLVLPLFAARSFTLLSSNPGPLPGAGGQSDNGVVPAREAGGLTPARMGW